MIEAVYIHVPFCSHICNYCDFTKVFYNNGWAEQYLKMLQKEATPYADLRVNSVYLGGGTPSALNQQEFETLLLIARKFLKQNGEFTVEVNSESCDENKVKLMAKYQVNRVSIGVQTFNTEYLKLLGRKHSEEQVISLIKMLKEHGITNISADLMFGFPRETKKVLGQDLQKYLELGVEHISCYPLQIEEHTIFANQGIKALNDDKVYAMYEEINRVLAKAGYSRYEISNFAKNEHVSKHNLVYWHDQEYLGLGPGSSGYVAKVRYDNTKSIIAYNHGVTRINEHLIQGNEEEFEYIMLNLRLKSGIDFKDYQKRFNKVFLEVFSQKVKMLVGQNLMSYDDAHIYITEKGIYISNSIIAELTLNLDY